MQHRLRFLWLVVLLPFSAQADTRLGLTGAPVDTKWAPAERAIWPIGPQLLSSSLGVMPAHTTLGLQPLTAARGHGVRLLGNYDLDALTRWQTIPSGFRASTGVLLTGGNLRSVGGDNAVAGYGDGGSRWTSGSSYVGLGYTGGWQRAGLRFSADLGVSTPVFGAPLEPAYAPGNAATLGDDGWRLRSGPLLQLGMDYTF